MEANLKAFLVPLTLFSCVLGQLYVPKKDEHGEREELVCLCFPEEMRDGVK